MRENPLVAFFVERFVFATAIFVGLVLVGLLLGLGLGVELLPRFSVPVVAVSTSYPGAGPEEVAEQVSKPLEDALSTLSGVDTIGSSSTEGFSLVFVQFQQGVDVDRAAVEASQKVAAARGQLPKDASAPVVQKFDPSASPILYLALEAPGEDLSQVLRYAERTLKPKLQLVQGVADIRLTGAPKRSIRVYLDPDRLQALGVAPGQVAQALSASALNLPLGSLTEGEKRLVYTLRSTPATAGEVADLLLDPSRGLRVRDVARVEERAEEPTTLNRLNGRPAVLLAVVKTPDSNAVAVADGVKRALSEIRLPQGYRAEVALDTTRFIRAAVEDTVREAFLAALAVSLVVLVFLGKLNSVFSVILAIPITLSGAILLFGVLGFTYNLISLLALTVAVGIVVDDSIVVAENIDRYRRMGFGPKEAVLKGASEVSVAVAAATLSLLAVFLPISFLPGLIGQIFQQFGLGMAAAIAVSWLEALLFLTVRLAYFPDPEPPTLKEAFRSLNLLPQDLRFAYRRGFRTPLGLLLGGMTAFLLWRQGPLYLLLLPLYPALLGLLRYLGRFLLDLAGAATRLLHGLAEAGLSRLTEAYARSLAGALRRPGLVLGIAGLAFFSIFPILPKIPFNFTPRSDTGVLTATLLLPKDTPLAVADRAARTLEAYFLTHPAVLRVVTTVGASAVGGAQVGDPSRVQLQIVLKPKGERQDIFTLTEAFNREGKALLKDFPGADLRVLAQTGPEAGDADLQFFVTSPDRALLEKRAQAITALIAEKPYVMNVKSTLEATQRERVFVPDPARLAGTGLTPADLAQALRLYLSGTQAATARRSGEEFPVVVQADPLRLGNEADLLSLPVYAPALQAFLPLGSLGRFVERPGPTLISRRNQAYAAGININLKPDAPGSFQIQRELETELREKGLLGDGVELIATGLGSFTGELARLAPLAFLLALVLNYLVIASQFNAWRYPLYLLLPVPLALVGAFWLTYLLGTGLDVISVLGVVMLIGLVTKNAILLLDFAVKRMREMPLKNALVEAARLRLRPILMTTLTVLIISLPLLLGTGEGAEYRKPLGVIILGGLLSSTLLTLFVVPAAFYAFERRRAQEPVLR
ncbi:efflux RND transporter permease subunit [Thermus tengchongensis]|uniref:Efflux RND transporter permease subunit n=1 Tax=Thermus tengchongensis TaxID=1214928 RepID=A0A4Y9FFW7_9DEIN|nr:efflux RND transporter permease subunit [Thermus tengchongensis]TFU27460.1 efflux RND transporter permease subunit [Thermus tengchongensis]